MNDKTGFGMVPRHLEGQLSAIELAVYVALSWSADSEGKCWPSHKSLATSAGCSERSAQNALQSLKAKSLVSWRSRTSPEGDPMSNVYHLAVWVKKGSTKAAPTPGRLTPTPPSRPGGVVQEVHQGGAGGADELDHLNKTNASTKARNSVPDANAASRGQRDRSPLDLQDLIYELESDLDAHGLLANWGVDAEDVVEAAWGQVTANDAINDKSAWLAQALFNQQTPVGKAVRLLKLSGVQDD